MLVSQLALLPLFCMALLKSPMLSSSLPLARSGLHADHANPTADEQAYALLHGSSVHPAVAILMVHPNILLQVPACGIENHRGVVDRFCSLVRSLNYMLDLSLYFTVCY
jgi:hypothetical protein